jgi:hypothetical protein
MKEQNNRTKWLHLRLTQDEQNKLNKLFKASCCPKISDYARAVLLGKPIIASYRNTSMDDFMTEMIRLRTELNSIGNNFNQLVKRANTYKDDKTISGLLVGYELDRRQLLRHIETIKLFIEKNAASW